jgi:outer membrane protein TolC
MMSRTHTAALLLLCAAPFAHGQISLNAAVDLAVRSSPKVKAAQAQVDKALAALQESQDVYVPAVNGGAGLGQSYGYSTNPPTLFTVSAQSLVFNSSQFDFIRSARAGYQAAQLSLADARDNVARDTALAYLAVDHDQQRENVMRQQLEFATRLASIEKDRFSAGRDTAIDLTTAKLTAAQLKLSLLHSEDASIEDREHLARLIGLPASSVRVTGDLPPMPAADLNLTLATAPMTPAVAAAFANAHAKQEQAFGDARFLYRPQISLFVQFNRYAKFANSFTQLTNVYGKIGADEEAFGVQINVPFFDPMRKAKARESAADAANAYYDAEQAQFLSIDSRSKLGHSIAELKARIDVAQLDQQLAQQQLDAISTQLNLSAAAATAQPLSPKDEQNQRIAEREKYLTLIDANYELHEAEINLLHESGQLGAWLKQPSIPQAPTP